MTENDQKQLGKTLAQVAQMKLAQAAPASAQP
jgi:hypothetical protein